MSRWSSLTLPWRHPAGLTRIDGETRVVRENIEYRTWGSNQRELRPFPRQCKQWKFLFCSSNFWVFPSSSRQKKAEWDITVTKSYVSDGVSRLRRKISFKSSSLKSDSLISAYITFFERAYEVWEQKMDFPEHLFHHLSLKNFFFNSSGCYESIDPYFLGLAISPNSCHSLSTAVRRQRERRLTFHSLDSNHCQIWQDGSPQSGSVLRLLL